MSLLTEYLRQRRITRYSEFPFIITIFEWRYIKNCRAQIFKSIASFFFLIFKEKKIKNMNRTYGFTLAYRDQGTLFHTKEVIVTLERHTC